MRFSSLIALGAALLASLAGGDSVLAVDLDQREADAPAEAPARALGRGVFLLPGGFPHGWSPDGNTVVLQAPRGLIVFDTGRHVWHSNVILAFAAEHREPIAAIINSHWHFDHTSGNHRIAARFPDVRIYASSAVARALETEAADVADARRRIADPGSNLPPHRRTEFQIYVDAMDDPAALSGTDTIRRSQRVRIAGRWEEINVAQNAVTDSDLWLFDRGTRIAVLGDLVTMPAPWFESACPHGWSRALDAVWATPFVLAVPGHGEPMTRAQFNIYRTAFHSYVACVDTNAAREVCAAQWRENIGPLLEDTQDARDTAEGMALYYVDFLRQHGGKSPTCLAR